MYLAVLPVGWVSQRSDGQQTHAQPVDGYSRPEMAVAGSGGNVSKRNAMMRGIVSLALPASDVQMLNRVVSVMLAFSMILLLSSTSHRAPACQVPDPES
jgi:hypothetical protein